MKINFTKKEYQQLVTMIEISDWVMNSHQDVDNKETEKYRSVRNKILSYAAEMGMGDCYIKEGDSYYETREYEENAMQRDFIDEYDEDSFWDQLVTRLTDRDYYNKYGDDEVDYIIRIDRFTEIEEIYANEVNESGITNITFTKNHLKKNIH